MEFQTLKKNHLKRNIVIGVMVVAMISAIILNFTRAKYRTTQSIPLVNGTINYSLADLNIINLYVNGIEVNELDINTKYVLDKSKSTCLQRNGEKIQNLVLNYDTNTGSLSIKPFLSKGTKCTLYFDEKIFTLGEAVLANASTQLTRTDFSTTVTNTTTGTIYYEDTSNGKTYYFAGNPTDNWVKFADFFWRIIRINEDGSIRMIYQGTSANTTGNETQIQTRMFNSSNYNNNMYVGYMYTSGEVHGLETSSMIKSGLETWYQNNLSSYTSKIDTNTGFCGDREPSTNPGSSDGNGGTNKTSTYYGSYIRLASYVVVTPTFKCKNSSDLYTISGSVKGNRALTYPIGLITADEVVYAGGSSALGNQKYYLYTGKDYWTISPCFFNGNYAFNFTVNSSGAVDWEGTDTAHGVRPVINLKASVTISGGNGTSDNPYTISD